MKTPYTDCLPRHTDSLPRCTKLLLDLSTEIAVMRDALLRYDLAAIERQCIAQELLCRQFPSALSNLHPSSGAATDANGAFAKELRSAAEKVRRLNREQSTLVESGVRALRVRSNLIALAAPELAPSRNAPCVPKRSSMNAKA
jgi:hypothetical protein